MQKYYFSLLYASFTLKKMAILVKKVKYLRFFRACACVCQ